MQITIEIPDDLAHAAKLTETEWIVIRSACDHPLVKILQAELDDGEAE